jgi:hypothetical protein
MDEFIMINNYNKKEIEIENLNKEINLLKIRLFNLTKEILFLKLKNIKINIPIINYCFECNSSECNCY